MKKGRNPAAAALTAACIGPTTNSPKLAVLDHLGQRHKPSIENHEPYWISTRTRDGSHRGALRALHRKLDPGTIQPIRWNVLKKEALPLGTRDWVWIDDDDFC